MKFPDRLRQTSLPVLLVVGIFAALLASFVLGAFVFRHISNGGDKIPQPIAKAVVALAEAPSRVKQAATEVFLLITVDEHHALLIAKDKVWGPGWEHKFPAPDDDGFLLLSGLSPTHKQSTVRLIRIADGQVIAEWVPDWKLIYDKTSHHRWAPKGSSNTYRAIHPLLLKDGSLIFNTGASLVRQPLCSRAPAWVLNYPHHHSIELAPDGQSIWAPSVTENFYSDHPVLRQQLRDDSLAQISLDGRVIQNLSFSKILIENGFTSQLLGTTGVLINPDPIHLNQISPAETDTPFWNKGDLLISARHLSTVYLYRPSSGKIIWHQQGPWLNQHSAHFHKSDAIAVFGNDIYAPDTKDPFINHSKRNAVYLHNFDTKNTQEIHQKILNEMNPRTKSQGRVRVLDNLDFFIEETNNARLFKINSHGNLQWVYLNEYSDNVLGDLGWSRYLTRTELSEIVEPAKLECN